MKDWLTARRLDSLYTALQQRLSPHRVLHTLGASQMAVRLAAVWDVDPHEALAAALLHDIGKEIDGEDQWARIARAGVEVDPEDRDFPGIWHAILGEAIAKEEFEIASPRVLRAIRLHPTGDDNAGDLERIVYLADYIEPARCFEGVGELRLLAETDLTAAYDKAVIRKTNHILQGNKRRHPRSKRARLAAEQRLRRSEPEKTAAAGEGRRGAGEAG
ncbi:MAG TPA: bis(5'-nucleosyl)-tetraphosphatase (symmetrical) YqeK [Sumerlaeia bacterium]|nr:bis(5'-nucleosyl)-tetraphosphatase (symmetrical) YqeK [Sumerlaeia bacterium]